MKYTSQRNRLAAVEAALGPRHQVLRIIGGLPSPEAPPQVEAPPVEPDSVQAPKPSPE
jgi:hypothetical protein